MIQTINDPPVPFVGPIKGGLTPGSMVRIQGEVPTNADRFNVNLHCGSPPSDIALHLSVRLLQGYIARNSLEDDDWGDEEGNGNLPIGPGQNFEILILCDPGSYKIAVNGQHFCEFRHRIPFNKVSHLEIDGKVELGLIAFEGAASAHPPPQRPLPNAPDFSHGNNPPPPPGNYNIPSQGPFGGGPGHYPHRPHGQNEESGLESFLGNAGTAIAGAMVSGLAENLLGGLTGGGGQGHHAQRPHSPMHPQQPQFQGGQQGHQQGHQPSLVEDLLNSLTGGGGHGHHSQPQNMPMHPQQPQFQGGQQGHQSSLVGDLLDSLASEMFKPSRRN